MHKAAVLFSLLGAGFLTLLTPPTIRAEEAPTQPYVILVGIDDYKDKQILDRPHAEADAKSLYDLFASKRHLGVDPAHIKLLLGGADPKRPSQPATRENVLAALKWAAENASAKDLVVFAFFGNGAPLGDRACYFAEDSTYKNRKQDAVASGDIEEALSKLKSQRFVALLDVYFKGFDPGKEEAPDPNLTGFYREFLGGEDEGAEVSRVVFLANSGLKPSLNVEGHGAFAKVLLEGLGGKADSAGYEADGLITVEEVAEYVREELPALLRKFGKDDEEKGQIPIVLEGQSDNFVIDLNPAVTDKVRQRLESFDKIAQKEDLGQELIEEGHDLLKRMPKLEARQDLRKAYQKLADREVTLEKFRTERNDILASTRLSDRDAANYAQMVLRATRMVGTQFVRKVNQGDLIKMAVEGMYRAVNEKVPSRIDDKLKETAALREIDMLRVLVDARRHLGKREDLGEGKDVTYSLHRMLSKLDRHTDYIDPETVERMRIEIGGNFSGIGVQIRRNTSKDMLQVVTPLYGSPAYKAGMQAGDLITTIVRDVDNDGNPLEKQEVISTKGMTTADAVKKIVGKEGTKVKLVVEREGRKEPLEFELTRGNVEVESVLGAKRKKDDTWDYVIDPESRICYVRLTQFARNTSRDLARVMKELSKEGIKGFILDLRFNPGGLLPSAVQISDLFIDDGMVVTIRPRNGPETSYIGRSDGSYLEFPMVCLVNGFSASGSEIVSACLQDHGRAVVMGSRSYGKGSVQTILPFDTGGQLKLTTASFWRPNGHNLNKASTQGRDEDEWGVTPDKGCVMNLDQKELNDLQDYMRFHEIIHGPQGPKENADIADFDDRQLDMALEYLRRQIRVADVAKKNGGPGVVRQN